jgi:uncharacterized DUF497 family protein
MFSWDARKAIANFEKHRVSFEEAATIFADPEGLDGKISHIPTTRSDTSELVYR